ncbi:hypothetical protein [Erwinia sp. 9145]|uniref:hypothetical protein n=1 Tax=Erwinia sp. 9145 TaxID=1500895 RepID=UPI00054FB9B3|nr:hypothetical protein [Erwinia sp. 9145]
MSWEIIIGAIGALIAALTAAFGIGHARGKGTAEQAATEREAQANIESQQAAARHQSEVSKGAADVQDTVTRMSDSAVDDELLRDWTRKD